MIDSNHSTALAIVAAGAMIGLGLYFGLRARGPSASEQAAPASSPSIAAATAPAAAAPVADRSVFEADAARALDAQRSMLRERCWAPAVAKKPTPFESTYVFDLGIDARGDEIARGISAAAGAREDVAQCLRLVIAPVKIAAPGRSVTVRVPLKLP